MEATMVKLEEVVYSKGSVVGQLCASLAEKGQKATRVYSQFKAIDCRLVGGEWHYYVASEDMDVKQPDGKIQKVCTVYAEPGQCNENGEVVVYR
jgi:hypothetical protein